MRPFAEAVPGRWQHHRANADAPCHWPRASRCDPRALRRSQLARVSWQTVLGNRQLGLRARLPTTNRSPIEIPQGIYARSCLKAGGTTDAQLLGPPPRRISPPKGETLAETPSAKAIAKHTFARGRLRLTLLNAASLYVRQHLAKHRSLGGRRRRRRNTQESLQRMLSARASAPRILQN